MFSMTSTLKLDDLAQFVEALPTRAQAGVNQVAKDVQADAQGRAPVDTGFMRDHVYRLTDTEDAYADGGDPRMLPKVARPPGITATVAAGAHYSDLVNDGTHKMAAQPWWTPAVEDARQTYQSTIEQAVKG